MNHIIETNKRVCKTCMVEHLRILVGKFNNKDKKFVDEHGMTWNGHTCGYCNRLRVRSAMARLNERKKAEKKASKLESSNGEGTSE